jgi:uncharacterized protein YgbK (DUF1537 family)
LVETDTDKHPDPVELVIGGEGVDNQADRRHNHSGNETPETVLRLSAIAVLSGSICRPDESQCRFTQMRGSTIDLRLGQWVSSKEHR